MTEGSACPRWAATASVDTPRARRSVGLLLADRIAALRAEQRRGGIGQAPFRFAAEGGAGGGLAARSRSRYVEPHHTRRLTDGGPDDFHHVIALCPTCHRRVHYGTDGAPITLNSRRNRHRVRVLSAMVLAPDAGIRVVVFSNTGGLDGRGVSEPLAAALLRRLLGLPDEAIRTAVLPAHQPRRSMRS